jgi:protein TonB
MSRTNQRRKWTAPRIAAAAAALVIEGSLAFLLIDGLRARWLKPASSPALTVTEITAEPTPPPPPKPNPRPPAAAAPAAPAVPQVEPSPRIALPSPSPAATAAGAGSAANGSGAGGVGSGSGAGSGGTGTGSGVAVPAQRIAGGLSDRDYPRDAARASGTVGIGFTVLSDGRVGDCRVLGSSGSPRLDALTCSLVVQRFRYRPARDQAGQPVDSTVRTAFTWGTREH